MKKISYFLVSMALLGSITQSCVESLESQSVEDIRIAKAEELKALASLYTAEGEAAVIKAEAEKILAEAEAKLIEAEAAKSDAEAALIEAETALIEAQIAAQDIANEAAQAALEDAKAKYEANKAIYDTIVAEQEALKQSALNQLTALIEQAEIDAIYRQAALIAAQEALEEAIKNAENPDETNLLIQSYFSAYSLLIGDSQGIIYDYLTGSAMYVKGLGYLTSQIITAQEDLFYAKYFQEKNAVAVATAIVEKEAEIIANEEIIALAEIDLQNPGLTDYSAKLEEYEAKVDQADEIVPTLNQDMQDKSQTFNLLVIGDWVATDEVGTQYIDAELDQDPYKLAVDTLNWYIANSVKYGGSLPSLENVDLISMSETEKFESTEFDLLDGNTSNTSSLTIYYYPELDGTGLRTEIDLMISKNSLSTDFDIDQLNLTINELTAQIEELDAAYEDSVALEPTRTADFKAAHGQYSDALVAVQAADATFAEQYGSSILAGQWPTITSLSPSLTAEEFNSYYSTSTDLLTGITEYIVNNPPSDYITGSKNLIIGVVNQYVGESAWRGFSETEESFNMIMDYYIEEQQALLTEYQAQLATYETELATAKTKWDTAIETYTTAYNTNTEKYILLEKATSAYSEANNALTTATSEKITADNTVIAKQSAYDIALAASEADPEDEELAAATAKAATELDAAKANATAALEAQEAAQKLADETLTAYQNAETAYQNATNTMNDAKTARDNAETAYLNLENSITYTNQQIANTEVNIAGYTKLKADYPALKTLYTELEVFEAIVESLAPTVGYYQLNLTAIEKLPKEMLGKVAEIEYYEKLIAGEIEQVSLPAVASLLAACDVISQEEAYQTYTNIFAEAQIAWSEYIEAYIAFNQAYAQRGRDQAILDYYRQLSGYEFLTDDTKLERVIATLEAIIETAKENNATLAEEIIELQEIGAQKALDGTPSTQYSEAAHAAYVATIETKIALLEAEYSINERLATNYKELLDELMDN